MYAPVSVIETAEQSNIEGYGYAIVSANTVWIWDLILSFSEDVRSFSGRKLQLYDLVYLSARITTGGLLATTIGFLVNSGAGCQHTLTVVTWLEALSLVSNSTLFLLRVLAIYAGSSRKVKVCFTLVWSTTFLAISVAFCAETDSTAFGCSINQIKPLGALGWVATTVFDTLVFVAISVKMLQINSNWHAQGRSWAVSFIRGDGLSHLSKLLLRSGQYYYLTTIGFNILMVIMVLSSTSSFFSPTFMTGFSFVCLALQNIMTCRVFRLLRLGVIENNPSSGQLPTIESVSYNPNSTPNSETLSVDSSEKGESHGLA